MTANKTGADSKLVALALAKMIEQANGNVADVNHFTKVWGFAKTIGELEGLDQKSQLILEMAAITHDIACPLCRKKYGAAWGKKQEKESPALIRAFLSSFELAPDIKERIEFLLCHHHTYTGVEGKDWQILLEADYLVNADESRNSKKGIISFHKKVFKTKTGRELLENLYL